MYDVYIPVIQKLIHAHKHSHAHTNIGEMDRNVFPYVFVCYTNEKQSTKKSCLPINNCTHWAEYDAKLSLSLSFSRCVSLSLSHTNSYNTISVCNLTFDLLRLLNKGTVVTICRKTKTIAKRNIKTTAHRLQNEMSIIRKKCGLFSLNYVWH